TRSACTCCPSSSTRRWPGSTCPRWASSSPSCRRIRPSTSACPSRARTSPITTGTEVGAVLRSGGSGTMVAMGHAHSLLGPLAEVVVRNRFWMLWNLILAAVPLLLAVPLFRHPGRRGPGGWLGLGVVVLFLPNAPYVVTDLVHLRGDVVGGGGPRGGGGRAASAPPAPRGGLRGSCSTRWCCGRRDGSCRLRASG